MTATTLRSWLALSLVALGTAFSQSPAIYLRPFVAHRNDKMYSKDGRLVSDSQRIIAHREDGSALDQFTVSEPEPGTAIHITDASLRRHIWLEPFTESSLTFHLSEQEWTEEVSRLTACESAEIKEQLENSHGDAPVESSKMLGFEVRKITHNLPWGTSVRWVAPELDCLALEETQTFTNGSRNTFVVEKIEVGTPPPSLFDVPGGYAERSPKEVEALYRAKYNGQVFLGDLGVTNVERRYQRQRRR